MKHIRLAVSAAALAAFAQPAQALDCLPPAEVQGAEIVALSMYGGAGASLPIKLDDSQHETKLVTVSGEDNKKPIILVLTAYEPTVWDLSAVPKGRIKAIIAHGFYDQAVANAPAGVPIEFGDRREEMRGPNAYGGGTCRIIEFAYEVSTAARFGQAVSNRFGRFPNRLYGGYNPTAFDIDGRQPHSAAVSTITPSMIRAEKPIPTSGLLPGAMGLDQLVAQGAIRPYGASEFGAWMQMNATVEITGLMARSGQPLRSRSGYVALKRFDRLPEGLDGAHSITLMVPEGIPMPEVGSTHSTIVRLKGVPLADIRRATGHLTAADQSMHQIGRRVMPGSGVTMAVTWNGSAMSVQSFEPNRQRAPTYVPAHIPTPLITAPQFSYEDEEDESGFPFGTLAFGLLLAGFGGAAWRYRPQIKARITQAVQKRYLPNSTLAGPQPSLPIQLADQIETVTDDAALTAALHTFRNECLRIAGRHDLEQDLSGQATHITNNQFESMATRFLLAAKSTGKETLPMLEAKLAASLTVLSRRLGEIRAEQDQRNLAALDVHERYIHSSHTDGPFKE